MRATVLTSIHMDFSTQMWFCSFYTYVSVCADELAVKQDRVAGALDKFGTGTASHSVPFICWYMLESKKYKFRYYNIRYLQIFNLGYIFYNPFLRKLSSDMIDDRPSLLSSNDKFICHPCISMVMQAVHSRRVESGTFMAETPRTRPRASVSMVLSSRLVSLALASARYLSLSLDILGESLGEWRVCTATWATIKCQIIMFTFCYVVRCSGCEKLINIMFSYSLTSKMLAWWNMPTSKNRTHT